MPQIENKDLYNAIFNSSMEVLSKPGTKERLLTYKILEGTAVYRYVNYRNSNPQEENDARKIWSPLYKDIYNRWTGASPDPNKGSQGLYLTIEAEGKLDTKFAELEHYLHEGPHKKQTICYYDYSSSENPTLLFTDAINLRSLFLFTFTFKDKENKKIGIDLTLKNENSITFLNEVLTDAKKSNPCLFNEQDTVDSLYKSATDASFCRAIGNSIFEKYEDVPFFCTTSVRSDKNNVENMIYKESYGDDPINVLLPQGRISWFLNPSDNHGKAVYTLDDMLYNETLDDTELDPNIKDYKDLDEFKNEVNKITNEALIPGLNDAVRALDWAIIRKNVNSAITTAVYQILEDDLFNYTKNNPTNAVVNIDEHIKEEKIQASLKECTFSSLHNVIIALLTSNDNFKECINSTQTKFYNLFCVNSDFYDSSLVKACKVFTYSILSELINSIIVPILSYLI